MSKAIAHPSRVPHLLHNRRLFQVAILLVAALLLIPPAVTLSSNSEVLRHINPVWIALAFGLALFANVFAALVYVALCPKKLPLWPTTLTQVATGFTNRVLPGGLGGLGLNTFYLSKSAHLSKTEAATIAGANNAVGFLGFGILLAILSIISPSSASNHSLGNYAVIGIAIGVFLFGVLIIAAQYHPKLRRMLHRITGQIRHTLRGLLRRPAHLALALLWSMCITFCYVGAFWLAVDAAGQNISLIGAMLVFAVGNAALAVSPTPGGIGTTELAMTTALSTTAIDSSLALAIVIGFRCAAYWLPIIPGYIAFRYITNKHYV